MNEPHPRVMNSDPWKSIDQSLEALLDKIILEFSPNTPDDDIPDLLDDWDNRENAIEILQTKLSRMKGDQ